jgi:acyl-coenzyme A synthetase/AMP-(fatty) acid ligase
MAEGVFNQHPDVFRSALVGIGKSPEQLPVICIELRKEAPRKSRFKLEEELLEIAEEYDRARPIGHLLFHPGFPVDIRHNSKISREKLAAWAAMELA